MRKKTLTEVDIGNFLLNSNDEVAHRFLTTENKIDQLDERICRLEQICYDQSLDLYRYRNVKNMVITILMIQIPLVLLIILAIFDIV